MKTVILHVAGMDCASCAVTIEKTVEKIKGVSAVRVNYASQQAFIDFDEHAVLKETILESIKTIGYRASEVFA